MSSLTWVYSHGGSARIGSCRILLWSRLVASLGPASSIPCGRWRLNVSPTVSLLLCFALTKDLVNDARDRCGGVDYNTVFRSVFFRLVQSRNEFPFRSSSSSTPLIFRSLVKPPVQCVKVDFKDKNAVK
jgi:hypothetical protein